MFKGSKFSLYCEKITFKVNKMPKKHVLFSHKTYYSLTFFVLSVQNFLYIHEKSIIMSIICKNMYFLQKSYNSISF